MDLFRGLKLFAPLKGTIPSSLDSFTEAYLEAALWSSTDDDGRPLDRNYSISDFTQRALERAIADCAKFQRENQADIRAGRGSSHAGHDFWLTRNEHGAGFWDGDWPEPEAARLTKAAHAYGEVHLSVTTRGRITD